jgi:hypothetical protein
MASKHLAAYFHINYCFVNTEVDRVLMTEDVSRTKRDEVKTDGQNRRSGVSQCVRVTKYYQNEQSNNDEMFEVSSTHCKDGECMQNYSPEMARPRSRRGDNIKTNVTQTERNGVVWIHLAQDFIQ